MFNFLDPNFYRNAMLAEGGFSALAVFFGVAYNQNWLIYLVAAFLVCEALGACCTPFIVRKMPEVFPHALGEMFNAVWPFTVFVLWMLIILSASFLFSHGFIVTGCIFLGHFCVTGMFMLFCSQYRF